MAMDGLTCANLKNGLTRVHRLSSKGMTGANLKTASSDTNHCAGADVAGNDCRGAVREMTDWAFGANVAQVVAAGAQVVATAFSAAAFWYLAKQVRGGNSRGPAVALRLLSAGGRRRGPPSARDG